MSAPGSNEYRVLSDECGTALKNILYKVPQFRFPTHRSSLVARYFFALLISTAFVVR